MKIRIGAMTEEIKRLNHEIYKGEQGERLSIELKDTTHRVEEIDDQYAQNFTGTVIFVDNDGTEEPFSGYQLESLRKSYDSMGRQLTMEFKRGYEEAENIE